MQWAESLTDGVRLKIQWMNVEQFGGQNIYYFLFDVRLWEIKIELEKLDFRID
jgi:hypothetical protein